ncbi:MAG: acyltransferase family protein [Pseudomonadota bacterium]
MTPFAMTYRPEIDGLRALAVLAVVLFHAGVPGAEGGFVGVDVFLVLSGYLITQQLQTRPPLADFLIRRIRRLLPLMVLVCAVSAPFAWALLLPEQLKDFGQALVAGPLFLSNVLFWREAGYFTDAAAGNPLLHLWSLGLEGQFYLLMPLLILLGGRGLVVLAAMSFVLSLWASQMAPSAAFFLLPFRLWEFLAGALLALSGVRGPSWLGPLGLMMIGAAVVLLDGAMAVPGVVGLLPVVGTVAVLAARVPLGALQTRLPVRLGQLSYGIYLWHYPVFIFAPLAMPGLPVLATVPLVLALAWASWHLVERPGRLRQMLRPTLAATLVLLGAGVGLHLGQGAPGRLPEAAQGLLSKAERGPMPCHDALSLAALAHGALCQIGAQDAVPRLALIGDSHAGHLTKALDRALTERGEAALVLSRSWCLPLPGFGTKAPARGPECAAFMDLAWARVAREPEVQTIVMAAQWANGIDGARGNLVPVRYSFKGVEGDNAEAFAAALRSLSGVLALRDRKVIVVEPVPEFTSAVPATLARALWDGQGASALPPVAYAPRNGPALEALAAFEAATGARKVRSADVLCPGGSPCPVLAGDTPLYRDASHLSGAGAAPLVAALLKVLDDPPSP